MNNDLSKKKSRRNFLIKMGTASVAIPVLSVGALLANEPVSDHSNPVSKKPVSKSPFIVMHGGPHRIINANSPELCLINYLCRNDADSVVALFEEKQQFGGYATAVDTPQGRFEGLNAIHKFAGNWMKSFGAQNAFVTSVIQTRAGGRSVTELVVDFQIDDNFVSIPMAVVGDLRPNGKLDGIRIYFFFKYVPGFSPNRRPVYKPTNGSRAELPLLTGVIREYYDALHDLKGKGLERILNIIGDKIVYGGYRPESVEPIMTDMASFRKVYEGITYGWPANGNLVFQTIIDDGINCVAEWTSTLTETGIARGRVSQGGIAAYERDEKGMIKSIRICDNAGFEKEIKKGEETIIYRADR